MAPDTPGVPVCVASPTPEIGAQYGRLIRRLNVTIPDDLDAVLREAAACGLSEGDFVRHAIREKVLHDKYAELRREVNEQRRDILAIQRHLGLTTSDTTSDTTRRSPR